MKRQELIKRHIVFVSAICLFILLLKLLNITCPILFLFGIPCPTCGVSRALLSLLNTDFDLYFYYHPLALPLLFAVLSIIHLRQFKRKKVAFTLAMSVLTLNLILYVLRFQLLKEL